MSTEATRLKKLVDATIITTVSTVVAGVIAGAAVGLYQQVQNAATAMAEQRILLESLQKDLVKTQELITKELAPVKSHLTRLESEDRTSVEDLRRHEEDLDNKFKGSARNFDQVQQQAIP